MKRSAFIIIASIFAATSNWNIHSNAQMHRDLTDLRLSKAHLEQLKQGESSFEKDSSLSHQLAYENFLHNSIQRWKTTENFESELKKQIQLNPTEEKRLKQVRNMQELYPESNINSENEAQGSGHNIFNACYMEGSDYFPGWGYKKDGNVYKCGEEVSREWINSYWKSENKTFTIVESQKFVLDFSLALRLAKLIPGLKLSEKFQMDVGGSFRFVVRVEFTKSVTLTTSSQTMHGTERVWVKLYEAKKPWPWQDPNFSYVGNTYTEFHGPTGNAVIVDAEVANLKLDSNQTQPTAIQEGEIVEIDGKRYQMGYELIPWGTEVLGYRDGYREQTYQACQTHKAHFVKAEIGTIESKIGSLQVEDTDLHHFWNDKEILYRQASFQFAHKVILKRHWYNQRIKEKFRIYRKNLDSWFPKWEKVEGVKEVEREWNIATLTESAKKGSAATCNN